MTRHRFLAATLALTLVTSACSTEEGGSGPPPPPPVVRNQQSYIQTAIDPNNFFRWTRRPSESQILVPISVFDQSHPSVNYSGVNLSGPEFRVALKGQLERVRNSWRVAIRERVGGSGMNTQTRFETVGDVWPVSRPQITVRWVVEIDGGDVAGRTTPVYSSQGLERMEVQVALRSSSGPHGLDNLEAILAHELGHALGMLRETAGCGSGACAHSPWETDIMYYRGMGYHTLSRGDEVTMGDVYSISPTIVRADG